MYSVNDVYVSLLYKILEIKKIDFLLFFTSEKNADKMLELLLFFFHMFEWLYQNFSSKSEAGMRNWEKS